MSYANRATPPRTLTEAEARRLLEVSGKRAEDFGDHMLFAIALGTGLRISEISALNCGDVYNDRPMQQRSAAKTRVVLRVFKRCTEKPTPQEVMIGDALRKKLDRFRQWKWSRHQSVAMDEPLFVVRSGRRMLKRRITDRWVKWRRAAALSERITFHALRHTYCQRLYEATRDVRLVQRAARHTQLTTTTLYAQASADDVLKAVGKIEL